MYLVRVCLEHLFTLLLLQQFLHSFFVFLSLSAAAVILLFQLICNYSIETRYIQVHVCVRYYKHSYWVRLTQTGSTICAKIHLRLIIANSSKLQNNKKKHTFKIKEILNSTYSRSFFNDL